MFSVLRKRSSSSMFRSDIQYKEWFSMVFLVWVNSRSVVQPKRQRRLLKNSFQVTGCLGRIKEGIGEKWFQENNKVVFIWGILDESPSENFVDKGITVQRQVSWWLVCRIGKRLRMKRKGGSWHRTGWRLRDASSPICQAGIHHWKN